MKYTDTKSWCLKELDKAKEEYSKSKTDAARLEGLQGVSNMLTLLQQVENLINAEKINSAN